MVDPDKMDEALFKPAIYISTPLVEHALAFLST